MEDKRERALKYLAQVNSMTLATCAEGRPHAATVFYVSDNFDLYFLTSPESLHGRQIVANPRVSAAINLHYDHWQEIRGIQVEGRAECLGTILENPGICLRFAAKFPDVTPFLKSPATLGEAIAEKIARVRVYRLAAEIVWFTDNATGFGNRLELKM